MPVYLQTTVIILAWCLLISIITGLLGFEIAARYKITFLKRGSRLFLPTLAIGPICLIAGYQIFGINLIYPVSLSVDTIDLVIASIVPALVLFIASGLMSQLVNGVVEELNYWKQKEFYLCAKAFSLRPNHALKKLVLLKSFLGSWRSCLPWLFGELVIIECVFNAPGIAFDAWQKARIRNVPGIMENIAWLAALYILLAVASFYANSWLGKKLESYQ